MNETAPAKPLTFKNVVWAIVLANLITGVITAAVYFAARWILWM